MVTQICEGVRRYTAKQGREVNLALPPINYGGHPYHHLGMPGTIIIPGEIVREMVIYTMLGLWNDGYRKIILVNNHGHLWNLVDAIQEFMKRFQLPAIVQVIDWHRAVREFFFCTDKKDSMETNFIHAAEAETSTALLLFKEMVNMKYVRDAVGEGFYRTAILIFLLIPIEDLIAGRRGRGIVPSNAPLHRKVLLGSPAKPIPTKQNAPSQLSLNI